MKLNEITTDAVMALNPCPDYPREKVQALIKRLATETPFEVLSSIPANDARWFIANALPKPERVQLAEACARRAQEYADRAADAEVARAAAEAQYAAADAQYAAYWAADAAHWAAKVADGAGGIAAQRAEQHLAIRHGLMLLEGAK